MSPQPPSPAADGRTQPPAAEGRLGPPASGPGAEIPAERELCRRALGLLPNLTMVLDGDRRIVFASPALLRFLEYEDASSVIGKRFGEAFRCVHSVEDACGCGASTACPLCGALRAILRAEEGNVAAEECRVRSVSSKGETAYDLEISADSFRIHGERFTIVAIADLTDHKRRLALERIFLHDILNVVGGIRSAVDLLRTGSLSPADREELLDLVSGSVDRAMDEIEAQKTLAKAEDGDLRPSYARVEADQILRDVARRFARRDVAHGKEIRRECAAGSSLVTDPTLLGRVLGNMVLNALEAAERGQTVTLRGSATEREVTFSVHNPGHMPPDVKLQVFHRSFSTKAADRGLGTYGMKLLGERYLGGRVAFRSDPEEGTTFLVTLPRLPEGTGGPGEGVS